MSRAPSDPPLLVPAAIPETERRFFVVVGVLCFAAFLLGTCTGAVVARAQPPSTSPLELALLARVRLPSGPYVAHCRRARGGCEARVRRLAVSIELAAARAGVDPWLLAAVAVRESGLDEDALGAAGEHGVVQLHPRSAWGREAARACRVSPSDCTAIELDAAARLLAACVARCGSEASGLGAYNRGACGETSYSRAVLRLRAQMRGVQ